jgi:hypothetical protein
VTACGFLEQDRIVRLVMQLIASSIREKHYCAEDPSVMLIHTTMSTFDTLDDNFRMNTRMVDTVPLIIWLV